MSTARMMGIQDIVRYSHTYSDLETQLDGYLNFWYLQKDPNRDHKRLQLEAGISAPSTVPASDGARIPVVALRSSPWRAGGDVTPWHDEYDLDHGHIRYYGDHKISTPGPVGSTRGNAALIDVFRLHESGNRSERLEAPPILVFQGVPVAGPRGRMNKGHVKFCGACVMERLEYVVQRDQKTGGTFPNVVVDLNVLELDENDEMDWRWIDDRRNPTLTAEESQRCAPESWRTWVDQGRVALPRIRRRVMSSRVLSKADQLPHPESREMDVLHLIYHAFDERKHAFEWLASRVAAYILGESDARYREGWLTKAGGDGGMDFVGRLDVGNFSAKAPIIVLGQAKCVSPSSSVSPGQVARLVARLRRGWLGVFVTTGHFSQQAQIEMVDDEYPVVLVPGKVLAEVVVKLAAESYEGNVSRLLDAASSKYAEAIIGRRPEEILTLG